MRPLSGHVFESSLAGGHCGGLLAIRSLLEGSSTLQRQTVSDVILRRVHPALGTDSMAGALQSLTHVAELSL